MPVVVQRQAPDGPDSARNFGCQMVVKILFLTQGQIQVRDVELTVFCGDAATHFNYREVGNNGQDPPDAVHCQACETSASGTRETRSSEKSAIGTSESRSSGDSDLEEQEVRCR